MTQELTKPVTRVSPVTKAIAKVIGRYFPGGTVLPLVKLFNHRVLELGAGKHSKVGNLTLADNVALTLRQQGRSLRLRLVNYPKVEA